MITVIRKTYDDREYPNHGIIGIVDSHLCSEDIERIYKEWDGDDDEFVDFLVETYGCKEFPMWEIADV